MARDLVARPVEQAGPKRTMAAPTPSPAMQQLGLDLGGADGPIIESAVGALQWEDSGGSSAMDTMLRPTLGEGGMGQIRAHRAKKIAEASSRPPQGERNVPADGLARVLLTRIAGPIGMNPGEIVGLVGERGAVGPPDKLRIGIGGIPIDIEVPSSVEKTQNYSVGQSPVGGLTISDASATYDQKWDLQSGSMRGSVALGQWTTKGSFDHSVDSSASAQFVVQAADLRVGDLMTGTVDLVISPEGLTGETVIQFNNINLGFGLVLTAGSLNVQVDASGAVTATGSLTADIANVGTLTLAAQVADTVVTGAASLQVTAPQTLAEGLILESGSLTGQFFQGPFTLDGNALVKLQDWAQGDISAHYVHQGPWTVNGTINQTAEKTFGTDLAVSGAALDIAVNAGALQTIKARGNFKVPNFAGDFDGTYEMTTQAFNANGNVSLTEPVDFGGGTRLTALSGKVDIKDNVLGTGTGTLTAELPYEEQATFKADMTGTYKFQEKLFDGTGSLTTIRDVEVPGSSGYKAVIATGATGDVTVAANDLTNASGNMSLTAHDGQGELAKGDISYTYTGHKFNANGTIGFVERKLGEVGSGPSLVTAYVTACDGMITIAESKFQALEGTLAARLDGAAGAFATVTVGGKFDAGAGTGLKGEGALSLTSDWKLGEGGDLELVLGAGSAGTAKLEEGKLVKADGNFSFAVRSKGNEVIKGSTAGTYDAQAGKFDAAGPTAELISDLLGLADIFQPFTPELLPAYLSYRIWVLRELKEDKVSELITGLWDFLRGTFQWVLDALPPPVHLVHDWVAEGTPNVLLEMEEWLAQNLVKLGQDAIDWLLDMGDWGAAVIRSGGPKAIEMAGFSLEAISDAGQALGEAESAPWSWI